MCMYVLVSLCSPGWPLIRDPSALASKVLGLKQACEITPNSVKWFTLCVAHVCEGMAGMRLPAEDRAGLNCLPLFTLWLSSQLALKIHLTSPYFTPNVAVTGMYKPCPAFYVGAGAQIQALIIAKQAFLPHPTISSVTVQWFLLHISKVLTCKNFIFLEVVLGSNLFRCVNSSYFSEDTKGR